jgi:hypothetical protein
MCQKSHLFFSTIEYNHRSGMNPAESVANAIESLAAVYEWKPFDEPDGDAFKELGGDFVGEEQPADKHHPSKINVPYEIAGFGIALLFLGFFAASLVFIWSILGDMEADRKKLNNERLRKTQRMLVEVKCDECGGDGIVEYDGSNPLLPQGRYQCPMCGGRGKLNEYQSIDAGPVESE